MFLHEFKRILSLCNLNFFADIATSYFSRFAQNRILKPSFMDIQQRYVIGILFIVFSVSVQSQSLGSSLRMSIKDDMKKDLLKQVKTPLATPNASMRSIESRSKAVQGDDLQEFSKKYIKGSGGAEYEDKYQISPHVTTYSSSIPINKLRDGYVVPVFTGGHWIFANPTTRVDGLVIPSGLDLFGGGKKKMSAKSKAILEHVFNIKVEE